VAGALGEAMATARPRPARVDLNGLPASSYWPDALRSAWPGRLRPWHHRVAPTPAPTVPLGGAGDLDAWLGTRSSNFRQQMRRARRKFEKDGGVFRVAAGEEDLERDLPVLERLHQARWADRGGSAAMTSGIDRMLADVGGALVSSGRFLLISMEIDGRVISSQLFLAAGNEISYWNGGFDDAGELAAYKPAMSGLVEAVRISLERGYTRFDLGPGAQDYKYRFSDTHDDLVWQTLIPPGRQSPPERRTEGADQADRPPGLSGATPPSSGRR
jgi:CelD/BcsL family acetyltransferase involved in cellulose biosynthesis